MIEVSRSDDFVSPHELWTHAIYFMLSFFDEALLIPDVRTVVYLGKDVFGEGTNTHYFQSYEEYADGASSRDQINLIEAAEDKLMNFYELGKLASLLAQCAQRMNHSS